jgi:class 3 adenylate cyclase
MVEESAEPQGHLMVDAGAGAMIVPIFDQLFIGRECAGISERRRLVLDDPEISRSHLEIRLDVERSRAFVIDTSTNGSLLNGARLGRAVPTELRSGDEIRLGTIVLAFHSSGVESAQQPPAAEDLLVTRTRISRAKMVMVVGDIANYSTISEATDGAVVAGSLNTLWQELGIILRAHRGTLNHYAGDALCAVWEIASIPGAHRLAVDFALAADRRVAEMGPDLLLRDAAGDPIQMGWGVVRGEAVLAAFTRSVDAVIGDSTNLAFRLAGIAGREGRAPVMVTSAVHAEVASGYRWGPPEQVRVKGRVTLETIYPALQRLPGT